MGPVASVYSASRNSFDYSGRATRPQFAWFLVVAGLGMVTFEIVQAQIWGWTLKNGSEVRFLTAFWLLVLFVPLLSLFVRRSNDAGFHPIVVFIPAILYYVSWYVFVPLSREYAAFMQGPNVRPGSIDNLFRDMSVFLTRTREHQIAVLALVLALVPADSANFLGRKRFTPREENK